MTSFALRFDKVDSSRGMGNRYHQHGHLNPVTTACTVRIRCKHAGTTLWWLFEGVWISAIYRPQRRRSQAIAGHRPVQQCLRLRHTLACVTSCPFR